ncbi:putative prolyl 4-hydroxylase 12 isoform X1 [Silene latifolia]|uniref:putative prolyl 4-hydroxylase 12 isoform X1 n=1 Tax=Silene latifolia TaxID=37657 RepID=UPI003D789667
MEIMSPIPRLLFLSFMIHFSCSSAQISRKELRNTYGNQEVLVKSGSSIKSDRVNPSRVIQLSWQPRVFVYRGFLSDEDCDHLISLASGKTNFVVSDAQGRTARSLADVDVKDEIVARVEEKISAWTLLPLGNSRPLQILHYANEQTNEKYDYYGNKSAWQLNEPLMATVILSLSNTSRGGDISFPESQIKTSGLKSKLWPYSVSRNNLLKPVKGNAILFFNVHPNASPDKRSLHERNPVTEGGMWSAVKIFYLRAVSGITAPTDHENSDCTDEDESCPKWAALGECQRNAVFMVGSPDYYGTCRKSCKVC